MLWWAVQHDYLWFLGNYSLFTLEGTVEISLEIKKLRSTEFSGVSITFTGAIHQNPHPKVCDCCMMMKSTMTHSEVMQETD